MIVISWRCRPDSSSIDTNTDSNSHVTPILLPCLFISGCKGKQKNRCAPNKRRKKTKQRACRCDKPLVLN